MTDLKIPPGKYTKDNNCLVIATELYKLSRITLYPSWKPLIFNI